MVDIKKLSVVFLVLAVASTSAQRQHCPKDCVCFRKTIRCNQLGLTQIPAFPYDTLVVDIRLNLIRGVSPRTFANLVHAHTVYLSSNEIDFITDESFLGLRSLVQLYLNNNHLSTIPAGAFRNHPQLEGLYLENNDIWEMDPAAFVQLPRLSRLSLNNNKITTMPKNVFADLKNLRNLRLDGNPINCDCSVETLLLMQKSAKHPVAIYLTCEAPPNLHKREFAALRLTDFHCEMPQMIREPHDVETDIGETVELPCQVAGDPEPEVFWMYNTNEIIEDDHPKVEILKTGSLRINTVDTNDFGIYECIGRNEIGEIKSQPIRMVVKNNRIVSQHEKPQFITQPKDTIISLGDGMILDCSASGLPEPEIRWSFNGRMLVQSTSSIRILSNGSLEILSATLSNAGVYKCEASNELGTIEGKATIDVKELPVFIHTPQNETFNKGQTAILECDAEGNPLPVIKWNFNGQLLVEGNRISLENENTELIIKDLKQSDSGIYTCIASNDNGASEAEAVITVKSAYSGPRLVASPYDIEAFSGTTIELPCKGDDHSAVVKWQKDGRFVVSSERFQISSSGSLYIKNATLSDTGRYECSIKNEHGRATASGLVTIRSSEDLAPGDKYVRVAFAEAAKEIDLAINNTIATLFSNRTLSNPLHHGDLLRMFRFPKGEARQLARAAEIYERTLVNIRKHVQAGHNLSVDSDNYEFNDLLSREHLHLVAELSGCMEHREMPNCTDMCYHSKYRSIDGTCNNLNNPIWGASLTAFKRLRKPEYENGFSMPIGWTKGKLYSGYPKPISRLVSTTLISTKDITPDDRITHMVMQWGQFLDHDLDHAIPSVSSESWDGIDCKKTCEFAAPCYPIEVPPNDPRVKNRRCIDLIRSSAICGSGMTSVFFDAIQPREQINQLTSFIDASQVYGYTFEFAQELRNLTTDDGLLRTGVHFPNQKDMLPFAAPQDGMDCRRNLNENNMNCFVAGDIRVNEQLGLLAMHTIWMREHNRIAIKLKEINPHWDGDTLYQEARKVVGAQMQHITYKQWLPIIIGEEGMKRLGEYKGYDPSINPSVSNEFATAAFRFGHTLINPILHRLDENYQPIPQGHISLHKAFFAPWRIAYEGGVDPLMRGLFTVAAKLKRPDQNLNSELTEKLFLSSHAVALDLASMNIQRGREHGIPSYNTYRAFCNLTVAKTFDDLSKEISSEEVINKLKELYGHPDNIDIFVGGILEDPADGGKIGPLFQCLLVDQFKRLRDGDRFFYENPSVFLPQQLQQIKQTNLARVLCDNGDHIKEAPKDVFLLPGLQGGYTNCADIPGINLYFWQDCGSCESLPKLFDSYVPETYPKRKKRSLATDENLPKNINPGLKEDVETKYDPLIVVQKKIDDLKRKVKEFEKQILHLERSCSSIKLLQENVCTDLLGNTRMNSETWISGDCITCQCNQSHIICSQTKCPEVKCDPGMEPKLLPNECCPICTDLKHKQGSVILK